MKQLVILGSTGSVGRQTLQVCDAFSDDFAVAALTGGHNVELLSRQITKYRPKLAVIAEEEDAERLRRQHGDVEILSGRDGLAAAASRDCDLVVNALQGIVGLEPTWQAIQSGHDVALANKETLVAGGELITAAAREKGVHLLPVDSEHSAIFQCLQGSDGQRVERLLLTGSGGPFRTYASAALERVTLEQALRHPRWEMGPKITVDSATLMNKGLEVIEAHWLFDIEYDRIEVVIHPQSIVHSMVEFCDGAVLAQLGVPDMRLPIACALNWPQRRATDFPRLDFRKTMHLQFEPPDMDKFRCLKAAYAAARQGGSFPAALNSANQTLVELFLRRRIRYPQIARSLEALMGHHQRRSCGSVEDILAVDAEMRRQTLEYCGVKEE
jgi:1-deoxy-D-xylulose-5-phosphate reductoisomerase